MSVDKEAVRPGLMLRSLLEHFWLLALLGAIIALFTSVNSEFSPYFYWPYLLPASIAVVAIVAWKLWYNAPIRARQAIAALLVLAGAWLVIGPWLAGFANVDFLPATRASVLAGGIIEQVEAGGVEAAGEVVRRAFEAAQVNTVTLTGAGIGGCLLLFGGIGSWFAYRSMAESREASPSYSTGPEIFYGGEPEKAFFMQSIAESEIGD